MSSLSIFRQNMTQFIGHYVVCSNCMTTPTTQLNNSAEGYLTSFSRELGTYFTSITRNSQKSKFIPQFSKIKNVYLPYLHISIRQFSDHILYQFISRFLTYECNEYLIPLKIGNQQYVVCTTFKNSSTNVTFINKYNFKYLADQKYLQVQFLLYKSHL